MASYADPHEELHSRLVAAVMDAGDLKHATPDDVATTIIEELKVAEVDDPGLIARALAPDGE